MPQTRIIDRDQQQLTNPVTTTWSLKTEATVSFLSRPGTSDRGDYTLKFQPTLPVVLTPGWKVVARPEFTLVEDKPFTDAAGASRVTGVGDTIPRRDRRADRTRTGCSVGPTFIFPTASTERTGQGNWQVGPAGVGGYLSKQWLAGLIAQQWWSFAGSASRPAGQRAPSAVSGQLVLPRTAGASAPRRPSSSTGGPTPGDHGHFLLGIFAAKVVKLGGRLPVEFELEGLYAPVRPASYGEQFAIKLYITPVIPAFVQGPVFGP